MAGQPRKPEPADFADGLIVIAGLVCGYLVEIEAEAVVHDE